jgi:glycosyltransferase involved in cell wall biosynthesis
VKKHILIVGQPQFGSLVDTYQYCRRLGDRFDFTYVCWDYGHDTPSSSGTRVLLVSRAGGKVRRLSRLLRTALHELQHSTYDLHLIVYFPGCSILGLLSGAVPTVMDVRTGYVRGGTIRTWFHNTLLAIESMFFSHVSVISTGLRAQLKLPAGKCTIVPLGADPVDGGRKDFTRLRLLYVGTLEHRRIQETVAGFTLFCQRVGNESAATYEIVGSGPPAEVAAVRAAIAASPYRERVRYFGAVPYVELKPFLSNNNVGVAYIPIVPQFENQPSTKIFEYLLAGMAVVATDTTENRRLIDESNGVLCRDTPEDFCAALLRLSHRRPEYDSARILAGMERFTWAHIVQNVVVPYWESLMEESSGGSYEG